ncbi:hypothetical protein Tsp_12458, partial [Trichinella spiralis]|uniref:hypothetical protein n=1 Tax=Trichinella spiralis TaxID=6334 RepID=UPI0001EFE035
QHLAVYSALSVPIFYDILTFIIEGNEGSVRSRCSGTICRTFDRRANESGLYNVDSSWPTEYWVVKKTIASGRMQADRNTQRIYRNALRRQQRTERQYITGRTTVREIVDYSNDNEFDWLRQLHG